MSTRQAILWPVLLAFLALTGYVVLVHGFTGFYQRVATDAVTFLLFVDLSIALGIILVWMMEDARQRSFSFVPYLFVMLVVGVAGPLLYLIRRENDVTARAPVR
ncbi:MAG: DUF2834 domain-containing protein [Candidatus Binatia bacterium]